VGKGRGGGPFKFIPMIYRLEGKREHRKKEQKVFLKGPLPIGGSKGGEKGKDITKEFQSGRAGGQNKRTRKNKEREGEGKEKLIVDGRNGRK